MRTRLLAAAGGVASLASAMPGQGGLLMTWSMPAGDRVRSTVRILSTSVPAVYSEVLTVTAASDSDGLPGGSGGPPTCRAGESDDAYATFSNFADTEETGPSGFRHVIAGPRSRPLRGAVARPDHRQAARRRGGARLRRPTASWAIRCGRSARR